jgi:hypothetical protein
VKHVVTLYLLFAVVAACLVWEHLTRPRYYSHVVRNGNEVFIVDGQTGAVRLFAVKDGKVIELDYSTGAVRTRAINREEGDFERFVREQREALTPDTFMEEQRQQAAQKPAKK